MCEFENAHGLTCHARAVVKTNRGQGTRARPHEYMRKSGDEDVKAHSPDDGLRGGDAPTSGFQTRVRVMIVYINVIIVSAIDDVVSAIDDVDHLRAPRPTSRPTSARHARCAPHSENATHEPGRPHPVSVHASALRGCPSRLRFVPNCCDESSTQSAGSNESQREPVRRRDGRERQRTGRERERVGQGRRRPGRNHQRTAVVMTWHCCGSSVMD